MSDKPKGTKSKGSKASKNSSSKLSKVSKTSKSKSKEKEKVKTKKTKEKKEKKTITKTNSNVDNTDIENNESKSLSPQNLKKEMIGNDEALMNQYKIPVQISENPNTINNNLNKFYNMNSNSNNMFNLNSNSNNFNYLSSNSNNINTNYMHQQEEKQNEDKCEGCFQGIGFCFCNDCSKIYCKICDEQLHLIPAYKSHERTPLNVLSSLNFTCCHHKLSLRFYCESCDEPICSKCQQLGPHNNKLHVVSPLFNVYRKYFNNIKDNSLKYLIDKNAKIESIMMYIENLIKQTKSDSSIILRGINNEYDSIIDNLNTLEGKKFAMLNFKSAETQKELVNINGILDILNENGYNFENNNNNSNNNTYNSSTKYINDIEKNNSNVNKTITFLLQYKNIVEKIDSLLSKPSPNIELNQNVINELLRFPTEVNDNQKKIDDYEKLKVILKIKDDIIWQFIQTENEINSPELDQIKEKTKKEIEEWSKLADKYLNELRKYNLVCSFCGECMDNENVNEICQNNKNKRINNDGNDGLGNYTKEIPPSSYYGNNKHYFSEPTDDYENQIKINPQIAKHKIPIEILNTIINTKEQPNPFEKNALNISTNIRNNKQFIENNFTGDWVFKVAKTIEKNQINLYQVLSDLDFDNDDYISIDELFSAFNKINIDFTDKEKESLNKYLYTSGCKNNKINISDFSKNFAKKIFEDDDNNNNFIKFNKNNETIHRKSSFKNSNINYNASMNYNFTSINNDMINTNNANSQMNIYNNSNYNNISKINQDLNYLNSDMKNTIEGNIFKYNQGN